MFAIVGVVIVVGAVIGGFLMEHGILKVLLQPAELVTICGAALGTLFIANPLPVVMNIFKGLIAPLKPSRFSKKSYLDVLRMMNELFAFARKNGTGQLEPHIEDPGKSTLVGGYFKDPSGTGKLVGSAMAGSGESLSVQKEDMSKLKEKIDAAIRAMPKFEKFKDNIEMTITGEGLRLNLLESEHGMFFVSGSAEPTESGKELIRKLEQELVKLPNTIVIEGHTDAKPFSTKGEYSNWELSADRANAARRLMQQEGLPPGRIKQIRGFADQNLHEPTDPGSAKNRRVTVIVQYAAPPADAPHR